MRTVTIGLASLLIVAACGSAAPQANAGSGGQAAKAAQTPATTPEGSAGAAAAVATDAVTIANFSFSPAVISVKVGTTVTWTNQDQDAHTVSFKSGPDSGQTSQPLQMGDTYEHTFQKAGTVAYICSIHPYMKGMVVVEQ